MKKALIVLMAVIFVFASFSFTATAAQNNLCEKLESVNKFHQLYCSYFDPEVINPGYVEPEVPAGQLYPPSAIISAAEMIYLENPDKWTVVKQPLLFDTTASIVDQKPYGEYVLVPEDEYIAFLRAHFTVTDDLISQLKNYKVMDYTTKYDPNGTAIYNASDKTFIVPLVNHTPYDKNPYRKLVGYVRNGNTYDVYLNKADILNEEVPPAGEEYIDYVKMYSEINQRYYYFNITNDWMKYTVSLNGNNIKYLSNVKVNSIPDNLIRPNDIDADMPVNDGAVSSATDDVSSVVDESSSADDSLTDSSQEASSQVSDTSSLEDTRDEPSSDVLTIGTTKDGDEKAEASSKKTNVAVIILICVIVISVGATAGAVVFLRKESQINKD